MEVDTDADGIVEMDTMPSTQDMITQQVQDAIHEAMDEDSLAIVPFEKPHPLLVDHVIETIIQHLINDNEDDTVLRSRLVCKLWDQIGTSSLRSNSNKTVYFGKYFRTPETLLEFINYLKLSYSLHHFPIGKFYLCEDIFKQSNLDIVKTFFTDCASILTSLTIRLDNQSDLKVSELEFSKLKLPYLKCLVLDDRRLPTSDNDNVDIDIDSDKPLTFLEGLVKCSPNLQKLTVIHPPSSMFDDEETATTRRTASEQNVAQMLVDNCPRHLNYLNLDIKLNDKVFLTLSKIPVNLSELQLSLREAVFSKESLGKLLDTQKESLRSLRFCSMGTKAHFEIVFPSFPKLNLLELHSWDSQVQGVTFSKFTYQKYFPSLKSLVLHTWAENPSWIQFFPAAYYGTVPSLTSLKLPQNFMYPAMIQNLSWLYPNLKKLDLHFSKDTILIIQRVFSYFSDHLEELKIRDSLPKEKFDFCLDSLFTGLPQSVCAKILRNSQFSADPEVNHLLRLRQQPTLLNLKHLKTLDIEDLLRHDTYMVSDVTGYLVLLQMPSLRYLSMGRSQIADECLVQLAKKYPCSMQKELEVPKPMQRTMTNSARDMILTRTPTSLLTMYNYCASWDLVNNCVIC